MVIMPNKKVEKQETARRKSDFHVKKGTQLKILYIFTAVF